MIVRTSCRYTTAKLIFGEFDGDDALIFQVLAILYCVLRAIFWQCGTDDAVSSPQDALVNEYLKIKRNSWGTIAGVLSCSCNRRLSGICSCSCTRRAVFS